MMQNTCSQHKTMMSVMELIRFNQKAGLLEGTEQMDRRFCERHAEWTDHLPPVLWPIISGYCEWTDYDVAQYFLGSYERGTKKRRRALAYLWSGPVSYTHLRAHETD